MDHAINFDMRRKYFRGVQITKVFVEVWVFSRTISWVVWNILSTSLEVLVLLDLMLINRFYQFSGYCCSFTACFKWNNASVNEKKCCLGPLQSMSWKEPPTRFCPGITRPTHPGPFVFPHGYWCSGGYLLGPQLLIRWAQWKNSSSHRFRSL